MDEQKENEGSLTDNQAAEKVMEDAIRFMKEIYLSYCAETIKSLWAASELLGKILTTSNIQPAQKREIEDILGNIYSEFHEYHWAEEYWLKALGSGSSSFTRANAYAGLGIVAAFGDNRNLDKVLQNTGLCYKNLIMAKGIKPYQIKTIIDLADILTNRKETYENLKLLKKLLSVINFNIETEESEISEEMKMLREAVAIKIEDLNKKRAGRMKAVMVVLDYSLEIMGTGYEEAKTRCKNHKWQKKTYKLVGRSPHWEETGQSFDEVAFEAKKERNEYTVLTFQKCTECGFREIVSGRKLIWSGDLYEFDKKGIEWREIKKKVCKHTWGKEEANIRVSRYGWMPANEDYETLFARLKNTAEDCLIKKVRICTKCGESEIITGFGRDPRVGEQEFIDGKWITTKPPTEEQQDRAKKMEEAEKKEEAKRKRIQRKNEACLEGQEHEWGPEYEKRWEDKGIDTDTGEPIVLLDYGARVKKCLKCGKEEIIYGSATAIGGFGTEYLLESDGSLGGCM